MKKISVRQAIRDGILEEMACDPTVFLIGEEVGQYDGAYKVTKGLLDEFGANRVFDTPISEYGFTGIALGASMYGLKPVVEYMNICFSFQAIDHIISTASKNLYMTGGKVKNPIVFRGPNGWSVGIAAQHAQDLTSIYAAIPGLKVLTPWSSQDAKSMIKAAIRDPNPIMFLESETMYNQEFELDPEEDVADLHKAKIEKVGNDITVVAYSRAVGIAMEAADALQGKYAVEVINLRSVRPIDIETIVNSVKKTNNIAIVQMSSQYCSVGDSISAKILESAFDYLDSEIAVVSAEDTPVPYSSNLEQLYLPNSEKLINMIERTLG